MASNRALLYAEAVSRLRTPQEVVETIADAFDTGARSRDAEIDALKESQEHLLAANDALAAQIATLTQDEDPATKAWRAGFGDYGDYDDGGLH